MKKGIKRSETVVIAGRRLKQLRLSLHLTQRDLAQAGQVTDARIRSIEKMGRSNVSTRVAINLAEVLRVKLQEILADTSPSDRVEQRVAQRGKGVEVDGKKLRRLRLNHDLTQDQLAAAGDVTRNYISRLETGSWSLISRRLAQALANKLGTTVNEIQTQPLTPSSRSQVLKKLISSIREIELLAEQLLEMEDS